MTSLYLDSMQQMKTLFQAILMKTLIWTDIAVAFVCQWSMSVADAWSMPTGWRPISLERRLYDAELVVYTRAVGIRYSPYEYILLCIQVQVSPHQCSTPVIIGSGEQAFVLTVSGYPLQVFIFIVFYGLVTHDGFDMLLFCITTRCMYFETSTIV